MPAFRWLEFFNEHNIPYVTTGPNVSQGRAAVKCPFCGHEDPSEHMVVNLHGTNWWCWRRRAEHKGRSPEWLIQNLIHCSFDQARVIAGGVALTEDFLNQVQAHFSPDVLSACTPNGTGLKLPAQFKPFSGLPSAQPFISYMQKRGFDRTRVNTRFTKRYGLRYCTSGPYHGRIIFPVRYDHKLVSWTGRTISGREELRYKALTTNIERAGYENSEPAIGPISHYLLWYDRLLETACDTIYLTEGPFDALKITELGRKQGVCSTCFFTSAPTEPQINLLHELLPRFKRRYLLLDPEMLANSLYIGQLLASLQLKPVTVPKGVEDPGALDEQTFHQLMAS